MLGYLDITMICRGLYFGFRREIGSSLPYFAVEYERAEAVISDGVRLIEWGGASRVSKETVVV